MGGWYSIQNFQEAELPVFFGGGREGVVSCSQCPLPKLEVLGRSTRLSFPGQYYSMIGSPFVVGYWMHIWSKIPGSSSGRGYGVHAYGDRQVPGISLVSHI